MKRFILLGAALGLLFTACSEDKREPADYVDPFIGTDGHGHTFPGATTPFGFVQLSPDTGTEGWDWCSGYHSSDNSIIGFSHTHLNGTGAADLGDILFMPGRGPLVFEPGTKENPESGYRSVFSHKNETAKAGYYSVYLDDPNVEAELTATPRTGVHRYTFREAKGADKHILVDLRHGIQDVVHSGYYKQLDERTIQGWRRSIGWAGDHTVYFHAVFSEPITAIEAIVDEAATSGDEGSGKKVVFAVKFADTGSDKQEILAHVGISAISLDGAAVNYKTEAAGKDFAQIRHEAWEMWDDELEKIEVDGEIRKGDKTVFYTAMYHSFLAPNLITDADGNYLGSDRQAHQDGQTNYSLYSTWDTFRALHPLLTLVQPEKNRLFVQSLVRYYEQSGRLPVWDLHMHDNGTMIGYHSIPIIGDAYLKGQRDFDTQKALEAMLFSAMQDSYEGLGYYRQLGYLPSDKEGNSVSKASEYAFDDWVIAEVARQMGNDSLYKVFIRRAQYYKNHFDPKDGFLKARLSTGEFRPNFDPVVVSALGQSDYTEGNAWHYRFFVPQDVNGHIALMGGDQAYIDAIDAMFNASSEIDTHLPDVTGLIGQYAHGNEPSHQVAYLYAYAGAPWKTQYWVDQIKTRMYTDQRDGLSGNDDCGQMSAWYVFGAMGFYPVTPGSNLYVFGTPTFKEMEIEVGRDKTFEIEAEGLSKKNIYIQSVTYNGQPYTKSYITHEIIASGGKLVFKMGSKPNESFGAAPTDRPVSAIPAADVVTSEQMLADVVYEPFLTEAERVFSESITLKPQSNSVTPENGGKIIYTTDGQDPMPGKAPVVTDKGIVLTGNATLKLRSLMPDGRLSNVSPYQFYRSVLGGSAVTLGKEPSAPYEKGGAAALVNYNMAGNKHSHPEWIAFGGNDLDAVIDMGEIRTLTRVGFNVLNDPGPWILLPRTAMFAFSTDGTTYGQTLNIPMDESRSVPNGPRFYSSAVPGGSVQARYIKLHLENGLLPEWHTSGGNPSWLFIDEIVAY